MSRLQEKNFKIIVAIKNLSDFALTEKIECVITLDKQEQIVVYPFSQAIFFNTDHLERTTPFQLQFRTQKELLPFGSLPILIPQNVNEKDEIEIVKQFQFGLPTSDQNLKGSYYIIILNKQVFMDKNSGKQSSSLKEQVDERLTTFGNQAKDKDEGKLKSQLASNSSQTLQGSANKQRIEKSPSNKRYLQSLKSKSNANSAASTTSSYLKPSVANNTNEQNSQPSSQYNSNTNSSHKRNSSTSGINTTPQKASITQTYLVQNSFLPTRSNSNSRQNPTSSSAQKTNLSNSQNIGVATPSNAQNTQAGQNNETLGKDQRRQSKDITHSQQAEQEQSTLEKASNPGKQSGVSEGAKSASNFRNDNKMDRFEKIFKYSPPKNHSPYRSILKKDTSTISPIGSAAKEQHQQQATSSNHQSHNNLQQNQIPSSNNQSAQKSGILSSATKPVNNNSAEKHSDYYTNNIHTATGIQSQKNSEKKPSQLEQGNSENRVNHLQNSDNRRNQFGGSDTKSNLNNMYQSNSLQNTRYPATSDFDSQLNRDKQLYTQSPIELPDSPLKKRIQSTSPLRLSSYQPEKMSPVRKSSIGNIKKSNLNSTSPLSKSGYLSPAGNGLNYLLNLDGSKRESKHEIENLKTVIYSLDGKLKNLQQTEEMNRFLTEELKRSEEARKELQLVLQRQVEIEVESRTDIERRLAELIRDKQEMHNVIISKENEITSLIRQLDQMSHDLRQLDKDYHNLKVSYLSFDELKQQNLLYREDLNNLMSKLRNSTFDFDDRFDKLYKSINILEEEKALLSNQKAELQNRVSQFQLENQNLHESNIQKQYEIDSLLRKLSLQTAYEDGLRINNAQVEALNIQLKEEQRQKLEAREMADNLHRQIMDLKIEREEIVTRYKEDINLLKRTLEKSQQTIHDQSEALTEMSKVSFLNKQENNQNEIRKQLLNDLEEQLTSEKKRGERLSLELNELKKRSYEQCELLSTQNNEISQLKQNIRELTNLVDEGEEYAQSLKQLIFELRESHSDYIPIKGDPIDSCLAQYLNNFNGDKRKARTLFIREGSGVYQFGSKKVYVKIEQDKVLIRTGGGFIGLEEFLDLYTPSELEKYNRNDPLKVLNQNYSVNKKLSQSKLVNEIKEMQTVPLQNTSLGPSFSKIK
ncbi:hypothetical protein TTHERM_00616600 (macronuclear) [Tetrahymena thermophila SB210]|uniref:GAR domain-containing protein n=1 Tax=Tetrahymena thermophila (strain SB210) TaxID=312017 RepID=I7MIJ1_TETTS|nr:hypothetical protein TTHERM_00616600 [Tetrahymena thermophila SB210]EAS04485.1 hypothetical protein TTHERM_00616600 [Tetrahymena thermophila SB210]|eukprot:XP_001024730.1 hypothetical protein TTHERM_00616600 [Tetrahymena thermophila SB210]